MNDDEFTLDEVTLWDGGPVPADRIPVRGAFDELMCVRCVLEPQEQGMLAQTYICFPGVGPRDTPQGIDIMRITGAKSVNLWYRVDPESGMRNVDDMYMLRSLEQVLAFYEEEKKARMQ